MKQVNDPKFGTRKWNIVNNNSKAYNDIGNEIIYDTEVFISNLCDYNDTYIVLRGDITVKAVPTT